MSNGSSSEQTNELEWMSDSIAGYKAYAGPTSALRECHQLTIDRRETTILPTTASFNPPTSSVPATHHATFPSSCTLTTPFAPKSSGNVPNALSPNSKSISSKLNNLVSFHKKYTAGNVTSRFHPTKMK